MQEPAVGTRKAKSKENTEDFDFYITPILAMEKLIEKEKFVGSILEPCSGNGVISKFFEEQGHKVISSDIQTSDIIYGTRGQDAMALSGIVANNLITNPPYLTTKKLLEMCNHFLTLADSKIALLLRLGFLESQARYKFFQETPLSKVLVFSKRLTMYRASMTKEEIEKSGGGKMSFAWFIWDHTHPIDKPPIIDWLL